MTAQRYVHDILEPHVLPFLQWLPGTLFLQTNDRPHTTRASQDCLRTVTTLPSSSRTPDLSPIEHIWDHLGRRGRHPTSLNEVEARLQQIWNEIYQDIIHNLYASFCPIVSHRAFALEGVQQGIKSSVFLGGGAFSLK
ncbi:transposable element Tcb2 transposase [Trichonephila clavipes]|nr:transposable element Tcb2 transposase [Trichonephila clavipes]